MRLRTAHVSLQFSDSSGQHTHDVEKVFRRAKQRRQAFVTGTESGPGAGNTGSEIVRVARENGYVPWVPEVQARGIAHHTDCWIAVRKDLIDGDLEKYFELVIPGSGQLDGLAHASGKKWAPKGLLSVSFDSTNDDLGRVSVGAAHYLTGGREPGNPFWEWNKKLGKEISDWAVEMGKGSDLVFYQGDQNMADGRNDQPQGDTFFGGPLTSTWDELEKWENTGHGCIDVIASYNRDKRVTALKTNALNDREFRLNTDHFYVEATFEVAPRKKN
jgi:hypothetical protein